MSQDLARVPVEVVASTDDGASATPQAPARRTSFADLVGVAVLGSVVAAGTQLAVVRQDYVLGRSRVIQGGVTALCLVTVLGVAVVIARGGLRGAGRRLTRVWLDPPGGWVGFALGAIVSFPLYALFTQVLFGDPDSARIVAATRYLVDGHNAVDYFTTTQEPFLPPLLLAPAVAFDKLAAVKFVGLVSLQVMAGVTAYITFKVTRSLWGAAASAVTLMCLTAVTERAVKVPMYALMLTLGYVGAWYAYRAVVDRSVTWRYAVPAGVCLGLAQEAHGVGQLFLAVPLLVAVFAPTLRDAVGPLLRTYGVVLAVMIPRIVVNLADGGLTAATSPRGDYWITKGYVVELQNRFWVYDGVTEARTDFLRQLPGRFVDLLGPEGWVVVALAVLGIVLSVRRRALVFVLGAVGFLALAFTIKRIPSFSRYYAPFWPGLGVLVGAGVAAMARRKPVGVLGAVVVSSVLVTVAFVTLGRDARNYESQRANIETNAIRGIVSTVDDDKGIIGARSTQVFYSVGTDIQTWGDQFLSEDEYATYLTWPSDREVLALLEEHDIGWVYITSKRQLELDYNDTWLEPAHGASARHVDRIAASPNFCPRYENLGHIVYKVGPCPDGGPLDAPEVAPPPVAEVPPSVEVPPS